MAFDDAEERQARAVVEEWLGAINHHHLNLRFEASDALQQIMASAFKKNSAAGFRAGVEAAAAVHAAACEAEMCARHPDKTIDELRQHERRATWHKLAEKTIRALLPKEGTDG